MADYVELYIDQGSDFSTTIEINDDTTNIPQNVDGYVITSSLRKSLLSLNASSNLICTIQNAEQGQILLEMSASNTANLKAGNYLFDVRTLNTHSGETSRLIEGVIFVTPSITR